MNNQLSEHNYNLDMDTVLNFMGYSDFSKVRDKVRLIAEKEILRVDEFHEPWGQSIETSVCGIEQGDVFLKKNESSVCLKSESLANILRKSDSVAILLVTAGTKTTEESRRLVSEGKMAQALAVSAVGSAMVVDLMKALTHKVFTKAQQRNYGTTLRVGPGYTGWHLNDQATLFSFYDDFAVPIDMSHGVMMSPEKSLLGMVGLNPGGTEAPEIEPCRICDLQGCDMRKSPFRGFNG